MKQSKELTAFYNAYHDWLEAGAPVDNVYDFQRDYGLCDNLEEWTYVNDGGYRCVFDEMKEQFDKANLSIRFPFGFGNYHVCRLKNTQHLDPNRIKWVKAHLKTNVNKNFKLV